MILARIGTDAEIDIDYFFSGSELTLNRGRPAKRCIPEIGRRNFTNKRRYFFTCIYYQR